jgi:signal transduction histidine kinase/CheY-like chemotaxis protein
MEFPLRGADGAFRWFLTRVKPVRDSDGTIVRWFGTNTDIHAQTEAARALEEASVAKDEFLATASHELRTPLTAILGWARMLRSGSLDPSGYLRGVETIERNAKAQVQLIEDILDGSRIITGKLRLEIRALDLTALVQAALDAIRPAAAAKMIDLRVNLDPEASQTVGDPERLQQIVWNLANNAVKFTPKGGSVEVRLERAGTHIELVVSDSGEGIEPDFLPHVFERFRQAEGTTTRRHGGLGLGLALVRHLAEAHGGAVMAESGGKGKGAKFTVRLPVRAVLDDTVRATPRPDAAVPDRDAVEVVLSLKGVTVLIVDDEADARDLVATVLRMHGAEVATAANAAQGLEMLSKSVPQVLISDVGMPGTDGYELIRKVRTLPVTAAAEVPAIALTAYSREQDRRQAFEAGFQTHVAKPVEPAELVRVVTRVLRRGDEGV